MRRRLRRVAVVWVLLTAACRACVSLCVDWGVPGTLLVRLRLSGVVLGLGCRPLGRLPAGMVGFGLVVIWPAPCAACFVGLASSSLPFGHLVRVALIGGSVASAFVLFACTSLLPVRRGGHAWCGGAWLRLSSCVPPGGWRR